MLLLNSQHVLCASVKTRHVPRGAGVQSSPGGIVFVKTRHEPLGAGGQSNAAATRGPGGMSEEDQGQGEDQVEDTKVGLYSFRCSQPYKHCCPTNTAVAGIGYRYTWYA